MRTSKLNRAKLRHDALGLVLPFICDNGPRLIMALGAYFDESIRDGQGVEPISVAGYVFKASAQRAFRRAWKRVLIAGPTPTTHFHMTNLYARDYEYKGWSAEDRAKVLRKAVEAVRRHAFCGISVILSQTEFEQFAPASWKEEFGSIYSAACQMALRTTAYWMDQHKCFTPIVYIFENGHKFWKEADEVLKATGNDPELKKLYRYHTHMPLDKRSTYGLQAADMLAWIMTRAIVGFPKNHTMAAFEPILKEFVAKESKRYQIFYPTGDNLRKFFHEQACRFDHVKVGLAPRQSSLR
jgi:hypothetical protein